MEGPDIRQDPSLNSFWQHGGELRVVWKLSTFAGVFLFAFVIGMLLLSPLWGRIEGVTYGTLTLVIAVTLATFFAFRVLERRPMLSVGLTLREGWLRDFGAGWLIATILITLLAVVELALGEVRIHPGFVTTAQVLDILGKGLFMFALVSYSEELLVRGYPLQLLERRYGRIPALLVTSVVFSLMHVMNPSINSMALVNIFFAGLLLGSAYLLTRSLWLPIGFHHAWNFVQGNVFGFPVSGQYEPSVFVTTHVGSEFVSGGMFGPEGGILASVVLIVGTAALYHPSLAARLRRAPAYDTPADGGEEREEQ